MTEAQKKLKSYTGAYVMYISEGNVVITGREKFKNFKALFPVDNVREIVGSAKSDAVLEKCMGYSINNENPGWVKIADIKTALFGEDLPHQDMLQEFPFRSIPKKELHQQKERDR